MQLQIGRTPGDRVTVWTSSTLIEWTHAGVASELIASELIASVFRFTDSGTSGQRTRFYLAK